MNEAAAAVVQRTVSHTPEGFLELEALGQNLDVAPYEYLFGLKTAHNLMVKFLWSRIFSNVDVIPPRVVKSHDGRCRPFCSKCQALSSPLPIPSSLNGPLVSVSLSWDAQSM
jgi:hypothetical protein